MRKENITRQNIEFGKKVKEYRIMRGMSQDELAKKAGFKVRASISKIEKGQTSCNQVVLMRLAKALDVEPEQLLVTELGVNKSIDFFSTIDNYTFEEELLIELFRKLDESKKKQILKYIKSNNEDNSSSKLA